MRLDYMVGSEGLTKEEADVYADERELEQLRRAVRRELASNPGQRALAREIGVSRIVIRKFQEQKGRPTPSNLGKIREWAQDRPPEWTPFGAVILAVAVRDLPGFERARVRRELAAVLAEGYRRTGVAVPGWIMEELSSHSPPRITAR